MGITLAWHPTKSKKTGLDRLPRLGERLVRTGDGKTFEVAHVTTVEGGELHFALRSRNGERVFLCADDFFPACGRVQPFRLSNES